MKNQITETLFSFFRSPVKNTFPTGQLTIKQAHRLITSENYRSKTDELRKTTDSKMAKKLKSQSFDYVCFSGTFAKRSNDDLLSYSGLLTLDLDDLENVEQVANQLCKDKLIDLRLLFRSPSGNGLKVIVQTNGKKEDHLSYFNAYSNYLKHYYQLVVDRSGKDIARACFLCHDPLAISYEQSKELSFPRLEWIESQSLKTPPKSRLKEYVDTAIRVIKDQNIDITADYQDWITLGFALVDEFGDDGRSLFHEFSSTNPNYNSSEVDKKFNNLVQSEGSGVTIKSLWHLLFKHKVNIDFPNAPKPSNKLEKTEKWLNERYSFRYNQLRGTTETKTKNSNQWNLLNDRIFNSMLIELKRSGIQCTSDLLSSLLNSNFVEVYHPFKGYLATLPAWDGKDHIAELAKLIVTENQDFWELSIRKWLVALVASLLDPKAINQQVIVLCGPQGIGKTTFILNMIPDELREYVYSGTINPSNKDSLALLAEMLLINLDEMDNMNRSDSGTLKSMITTKQVTMRKAYGRFNETRPRVASFFGSVNDRQFLNDPTGSRRFLVIDVIKIDYLSEVDLGQVYLQAVHLFQSGFKHYFEPDEVELIEANNALFQKVSMEEEMLLKYFEPVTWEDADEYLSATEIMQFLNRSTDIRITNNQVTQVGKALSKLGFERGKKEGRYRWALKAKV